MLNLNTPVEPSASTVSASGKSASGLKVPAASGPPVWKILVLDQETKDILATVLRVQDLREIGVTLHVYVFSSLSSWPCLWLSDNFRHQGNFTRLGHRCPTCLPSTSLLQPWQISGELHKTSRGTFMNLSTSTFQSRFRGRC
jgi:hypothetical protein